MVNLFSKMIPTDYEPLSSSKHSELRASLAMQDVDIDSIGLSKRGSLNVSVGYTFSDAHRNPTLLSGKRYSSNLSFREIYQHLTELNGGQPFIDTYFSTLFRAKFEKRIRAQSRKLLSALDEEYEKLMAAQVMGKDGTPDKRTKAHKMLRQFEAWKKSELTSGFDDLSQEIKKHIQQCLAMGRIPLLFMHNSTTLKKRTKLGLTPIRAFYATGQLIDNVIISYTADWK